MDIQFLGTGAGQPSKARNVSSLALKLLDEINEVWLFDCGEGTQIAFWKPQFDHVRSAKSLLPTYMETTSLVCQVSFLAVPFRPMKSRQIWKFMDLKESSLLS